MTLRPDRRHFLGSSLVALTGLAAPAAGRAQPAGGAAYPTRAIRFVVPYPPGGGTDVIARILQPKLQAELGQTVAIDNRGGAGGSVGTDLVAKAPADGYTVLFTLSSHTINPAIYPKLPFDTQKDFESVGMVASLPQILVASANLPVRNLTELLADAKANPAKYSFASVGNGSPGHLAGELMCLRAGVQITHIPYRGGGPAMTDVIGGQVPLLWVSIPAAAQFVKAGKVKAFAVSTTKRSSLFPDVPTMQESGMPDFEVDSWYAMLVPARTPRPIIDRLNKSLNAALQDAGVRAQFLEQGAEAVGGAPELLTKVIQDELPKWSKLAKASNITAN